MATYMTSSISASSTSTYGGGTLMFPKDVDIETPGLDLKSVIIGDNNISCKFSISNVFADESSVRIIPLNDKNFTFLEENKSLIEMYACIKLYEQEKNIFSDIIPSSLLHISFNVNFFMFTFINSFNPSTS